MSKKIVVSVLAKDFTASGKGTVRADPAHSNLQVTYEIVGYVEWKVNLPHAGRWRLHARMAAAEKRPCTLSINGVKQGDPILAEVTGSWQSDTLQWFAYGPYEWKQGENVFRIDFSGAQSSLSEFGFSEAEEEPAARGDGTSVDPAVEQKLADQERRIAALEEERAKLAALEQRPAEEAAVPAQDPAVEQKLADQERRIAALEEERAKLGAPEQPSAEPEVAPLTLGLPWRQVPDSGAVMAATQLRDGTILGIGMDRDLWTRATPTSGWIQVPNSGAVLAVTELRDGTILGIGMDQALWTRATLTSPWVQVPNSGAVMAVTQLRDGTIVGVGMDQALWTRATLTSPWVQVPGSGSVIGVIELSNGTLVGVGTDKTLSTRATITTPSWTPVADSGSVVGITELQDGTLLGVGADTLLYLAEAPATRGSAKPALDPALEGRIAALEAAIKKLGAIEQRLAEEGRAQAAIEQKPGGHENAHAALEQGVADQRRRIEALEQAIAARSKEPATAAPEPAQASVGATPASKVGVSASSKDGIGAGSGTIGADPADSNLTVTYTAGYIEWKESAPRAGKWHLHARMAAAEQRPCTLTVNGALQEGSILGEVTGGFGSDTLAWFVYGPYELREGENLLRIDFSNNHPHLAELGFSWADQRSLAPAGTQRR